MGESTRQTFVIDKDVLKQLRLIAVHSEQQQKDILEQALKEYISKWQAANPGIQLN